MKREILTGALVGIADAALFLQVALWQWDRDVAVAAALALLAACSMATLVAMALPWLLSKEGRVESRLSAAVRSRQSSRTFRPS